MLLFVKMGSTNVTLTFTLTFIHRDLRSTAEALGMTWLIGIHSSIVHWVQCHPFVATFSVLVFLYNVHKWLYPDPILKLPSPSGAQFFGGHVLAVIELVTRLFFERLIDLITVSVLHALPTFTRNMYERWVGMYDYKDFIRCVDILMLCSK